MSAAAGQPQPLQPIGFSWRRLALALTIGTGGGALFFLAHLPLPWMIGAMVASTVAAACGLPIAMNLTLRSFMVAVLGVMLGAAFTPDLLGRMVLWSATLALLALYSILASIAVYAYFRRVAGYDRVTAYCASVPGGVSEMMLFGEAMGGDAKAISLSHGARILLIVMLISFGFRYFGGYQPPPTDTIDFLGHLGMGEALLLIAAGALGWWAAEKLKIPAGALVGPMVLSAGLHLTGISSSAPPTVIVALAQIAVGTAIGCRFAGTPARQILRTLWLAVGATLILLATTLAMALGVEALVDIGFKPILLAFSPGGVAEMSLIALSLGIDAAFVATHHVARIFMIVVAAPWAFRLLRLGDRR